VGGPSKKPSKNPYIQKRLEEGPRLGGETPPEIPGKTRGAPTKIGLKTSHGPPLGEKKKKNFRVPRGIFCRAKERVLTTPLPGVNTICCVPTHPSRGGY